MLNRTWRIILMVIALIYTIWPVLFTGIRWIALIAVVLLLLGEFAHSSGSSVAVVKPARRSSVRRAPVRRKAPTRRKKRRR